jgi:hypothetical protein
MPDRQVIEWDKDDIDALKFIKVCELGAVDNSTIVMDEEPDMSALR